MFDVGPLHLMLRRSGNGALRIVHVLTAGRDSHQPHIRKAVAHDLNCGEMVWQILAFVHPSHEFCAQGDPRCSRGHGDGGIQTTREVLSLVR
jgi:hypothetical protein